MERLRLHCSNTSALLITALLLSATLLTGCNEEYSPKQKAYPRVVFPERKYELFVPENCPFEFEKPVYTSVENDSTFFREKQDNPCWWNVNFGDFNGTINLTYKDINKNETFESLVEDAHKLSFKHSKKADYIDEVKIENPNGVGGILYDVGGDAASNVQFFLTDSNKHFIRGALYFNNTPNSDSMLPVMNFVREDLKHLLKTFRWK
jgi:gliding motility-associated lipoprotein GldD